MTIMNDIVAMAWAARSDERLSDGALYGKLAAEIERLRRVEAAARVVTEECRGDMTPSLGSMAKLEDALHAAWKARQPDEPIPASFIGPVGRHAR